MQHFNQSNRWTKSGGEVSFSYRSLLRGHDFDKLSTDLSLEFPIGGQNVLEEDPSTHTGQDKNIGIL